MAATYKGVPIPTSARDLELFSGMRGAGRSRFTLLADYQPRGRPWTGRRAWRRFTGPWTGSSATEIDWIRTG